MTKMSKFILVSAVPTAIAMTAGISASCSPRKGYRYIKEKWDEAKKKKQKNTGSTSAPTTQSQPTTQPLTPKQAQ